MSGYVETGNIAMPIENFKESRRRIRSGRIGTDRIGSRALVGVMETQVTEYTGKVAPMIGGNTARSMNTGMILASGNRITGNRLNRGHTKVDQWH